MKVEKIQNTTLMNYAEYHSGLELANHKPENNSAGSENKENTKPKSFTTHQNHKAQIREYNKVSTGFSEETLKRLEQIPQKDRKNFTPGAFVDLWF